MTHWDLLSKKLWIHLSRYSFIVLILESFSIRREWGTLPNAFVKLSTAACTLWSLFVAASIPWIVAQSGVSHDRPLLNPCSLLCRNPSTFTKISPSNMCSNNFYGMLVRDLGLQLPARVLRSRFVNLCDMSCFPVKRQLPLFYGLVVYEWETFGSHVDVYCEVCFPKIIRPWGLSILETA